MKHIKTKGITVDVSTKEGLDTFYEILGFDENKARKQIVLSQYIDIYPTTINLIWHVLNCFG